VQGSKIPKVLVPVEDYVKEAPSFTPPKRNSPENLMQSLVLTSASCHFHLIYHQERSHSSNFLAFSTLVLTIFSDLDAAPD
jgi:hypothetical protein